MSYKVKAGDTLQDIATRVYGDPEKLKYLKLVNPGTGDTPAVGSRIITPPDKAPTLNDKNTQDEDGVTLSIGGKLFDRWTRVSFTRSADSVAKFAMEAEFDPDKDYMRDIFQPLSFKPALINIGKDAEFNGVMVDVSFGAVKDKRTVTISGYARPGILGDCSLPGESELEFLNQDLRAIASSVLEPFAITPVFKDDVGEPFKQVSIRNSEHVWTFLVKLTQQRNLVMTSDADGNLVFQNEATGGNIAQFKEGIAPLVAINTQYSPQSIYSHVTGVPSIDLNFVKSLGGGQFTVTNPLLNDVFRPMVFEIRDAYGDAARQAVEVKAAKMYGGAATVDLLVSGWRNTNGELWKANSIVSVEAPGVGIYKPYDFLVREVNFQKSGTSKTATLSLIFPNAFSAKLPESLPWN